MPKCAQCQVSISPHDKKGGKVSHVDSPKVLHFCGEHYNSEEARAIVQANFDSLMRERREDAPPKKGVPDFDKAAVNARSRQRGQDRSREVRRAG